MDGKMGEEETEGNEGGYIVGVFAVFCEILDEIEPVMVVADRVVANLEAIGRGMESMSIEGIAIEFCSWRKSALDRFATKPKKRIFDLPLEDDDKYPESVSKPMSAAAWDFFFDFDFGILLADVPSVS